MTELQLPSTLERSDRPIDVSNAIEVRELSKCFVDKHGMDDVIAVDGVSFEIKKGEVFGLLGPNGAGKSTIINILTGITAPSEGQASIGGHDLETAMQKAKELISVCPQEPAVYKFLSAMANIEFFGNMYMMSKKDIKKRAEELLKELGLYKYRNRKAKGYSGGMMRQLSLVISLIADPEILFLDEPTVGMDPRNRRKVWDFLENIKGTDKTIILTTHYIEEAEALCDRVAIVDYGKLIALGTPKELIEKYEVDNLEQVFMKITGRSIMEGVY